MTRPEICRVVLGPCAQFHSCEASEQKCGQTPKSKPKEILTPFDSSRKNKQLKIKKRKNQIKNDRVMTINVQAR